MTWRFTYPPLSSPMLGFTVKFNVIISLPEIYLPLSQWDNVKIIHHMKTQLKGTSHEITQLILIFLNQMNIAN